MTPFYALRHQVRRLDEELCGNSRKYSAGDVLFSGEGKRIVLGKLIAEGGEGSVFTAHAASEIPLVAKLYHPTQRMRWREQKLRLMCSRPIRSPCVAWPREILYDELRRFVGVLMPRADGVPLGAFAFHAELLTNQFPPMDPLRSDQVVPELVGISPYAAPLRCDPWGSASRQCAGFSRWLRPLD